MKRISKIGITIILILSIIISCGSVIISRAVESELTLTPKPETNNIHLKWTGPQNSSYKVYQKKPGLNNFETIGLTDFSNNATDEEIYEALKKAEILPLIESYKDKLDHEVLIDGKNFSGGQKQRLTIARAFLKKAGILILDDSTSAVDKITEKNIQNAISTLSEHPITKIIISQRISSVKDCDNIIVLEDGKITAQGNHKDLISNSLLYQEIYNSQGGDYNEK